MIALVNEEECCSALHVEAKKGLRGFSWSPSTLCAFVCNTTRGMFIKAEGKIAAPSHAPVRAEHKVALVNEWRP